MKKTRAALHTAQIITGIIAAAAAYTLTTTQPKRRPGQIVLITGGSRGLGLALAQRYARSGAKLVLAARDVEELSRARHTLLDCGAVESPDDVLLIPGDLTDASQAAMLIDHAVGHFGRIDILINNAGIIEVGPVENQPIAAYRRAMATNFFAALHTTHAALPHLLGRNPALGNASWTSKILGFFALIFASVNIFGGFLVTSRMLAMYKKKEKK